MRRFRGRLAATVTLWTAYDPDGRRVGLTVSSTIVVDGNPGRLLGVLDEESALWEALQQTGRFAVEPLESQDRQLADAFAGLLPAPGGPFQVFGQRRPWEDTEYGPVRTGAAAWVGCRLDGARPIGFGLLVESTIEQVHIGADSEPLVHFRGRYRSLAPR